MNKIFIVVVSFTLSACDLDLGSSYDPTTRTMYVDYYQEACNDSSTSLCFRTSLDTENDYKINEVSTLGFEELEWGNRYTVQVEAERDGDGKDTLYRLQGIDATEVIDSSNNDFVLTFNMDSGILLDNQNNSWIIATEKVFTCTVDDCALLADAYRDAEKIQLSFSAANNELTLLAVKCQSSDASFSSECEGINDAVLDIAHYRTDCGLFEPRLCLVYKEDADASTDWNVLPFEITDFTFQWGQQYTLDVEVKIEAKDLKSVTFKKENSTAIDQTDTTFKMVMRTGPSGLKVSDNEVINYDDIEFNSSRLNKCSDIDDAVNKATDDEERFLILQVIVETSAAIPVIIIQDLTCHAGGSDAFKADCLADSDNDNVYWIEE
jgi:hypothetical protein